MTGTVLADTLYIRGATHGPQARPLIEPFLRYPEPEAREEARLAAAEITADEPEGPTHNS
ncbi:hypothetical protein [Streptomyces sp. NPDC058084]|uniref:hypothetical protein n=1 Tax=Streptomyces sp. NPDC058084 TaxID=3346333 RepID=UPI0036E7C553